MAAILDFHYSRLHMIYYHWHWPGGTYVLHVVHVWWRYMVCWLPLVLYCVMSNLAFSADRHSEALGMG